MNVLGLFPGQGSQVVGMGQDFYARSEVAQSMFQRADKALGFPLSRLCFDGPLSELTLTQNAQPALLVVSSVCYSIAKIPLAAAAGHSLGEYSALVAAGVIAFEDAVVLVHKRGQYMQEAVPSGEGKMVAVMGPTEDEIRAVLTEVSNGIAEIANLNSPGQTVVAGNAQGIDAFSAAMKAKGAKLIPLNVSAPFHCSLMKPAAEKLAKDLDAISFSEPKFPVYANAEARAITSGADAREMLKKQVCASVRWTDSMLAVCAEKQITTAVEFGAGGVLVKLLKRIKPEVSRVEVFDSASLELAATALKMR